MENTIYVLNPNYALLYDVKRVLLVSVESEKSVPEIDCNDDFRIMLHPLHAQILAFFNGEDTYGEVIRKLGAHFKLEENYLKTFADRLIENRPVCILSQGHRINFPQNVLVNKEKVETYPVYSFRQFPLVADVDLVSKRLFRPKYFSFVLTTKCFTDCTYCYADRHTLGGIPLSTDRILELIDEMAALDALKIDFNGGEVLLHPDCMKILAYSMAKGYMPYISTKCPLSREKVRELKDTGIDKMQISLDCANSGILTFLLGVKEDYFNRMLQTISFCEEEGIEIVIHCILTSHNCAWKEVEKLIGELLPFGNIRKINIDPAGYSLFKPKHHYAKLKISEEQLRMLQEKVEEHESEYLSRGKNVMVKGTQMLDCIYDNARARKDEFVNRAQCEGNLSVMFVMPDGKVTICEEMYWHPRFILGDVTSQSVMEVWNSPEAQALACIGKEDISEKSPCKTCADFETCRGANTHKICWKEVQYFYGRENWDFPQPSCPLAPPAFNDCLLSPK